MTDRDLDAAVAKWMRDPDPSEGYIRIEDAAKLLGKEPDEVDWDDIEEERSGANGSRWVKLLPAAAAKAGIQVVQSAIRNPKSAIKPADPSIFPIRDRIPFKRGRWGERPIYISLEEAAARLGWSVKWTKRQVDWGYIEGQWRRGIRVVVLQSVEWWLAAHAEQKARRAAERESKRKGIKLESGTPDPDPYFLRGEDADVKPEALNPEPEKWITTREAYRLLGMTRQMVYHLARTGRIRRKPEGKRALFARSDVIAYIDHRETQQYKRTIPAKDWHHDLKHPLIRKLGEPPKDDRFITVAEAASILGVCRQVIGARILSGRLFAWQKEIGKHGSRVYLSENQVRRYAARPDRLRRREVWEQSKAESSGGRTKPVGWEEKGITPEPRHAAGPATDHDHGEYYTQKQAALLLGVSVWAVAQMRRRQRLRGFRKAWKKGRNEHLRWWFYRKEEVHALMNDPERAKRRDTYVRSQTPEGRAARQDRELQKWLKEPDYIPHDPANIWRLPAEVRRRIHETDPFW